MVSVRSVIGIIPISNTRRGRPRAHSRTLLDVRGYLGVAESLLVAFRVLVSDLVQPVVAVVTLAEFHWPGIVHFVGAETIPSHELDSNFTFPTPLVAGDAFETAHFITGEPALRDVARIVKSDHSGLSKTRRSST